MTVPVSRPLQEVNQVAHTIVALLQAAPDYSLPKAELKQKVRALTNCNKPLFERAFDRITQVGWAWRRPAAETGTCAIVTLRPLGIGARVWKP